MRFPHQFHILFMAIFAASPALAWSDGDQPSPSPTINPDPLITTTSLPVVTVGQSVDTSFSAEYGTSPYTWSISEGSLPAGISLDPSTGALTGIPSAAGTESFTVKLTDDVSLEDMKELSWIVNAAPSITTSSLPATTKGAAYEQFLTYTGGTVDAYSVPPSLLAEEFCAPEPWSISAGKLPPGLDLNTISGGISGTTTESGSWTFTAKITDYNGVAATQELTIVVNPPPSVNTSALPLGITPIPYSATLVSTGGTGAHTWEVLSGVLPDGLSLNASTGAITGTPTTIQNGDFTIQVSDSLGITDTKALALNVVDQPMITTASLPAVTVGQTVAAAVAATKGTAPYTWSVSYGSLPAGLNLDSSTGTISGSPTAAGTVNFIVKVTDKNELEDTQSLSWTVNATPTVATSSLPSTTAGGVFSQQLAATGGTGALVWWADVLPEGVNLHSQTGVLSGSFPVAGEIALQIHVTDSNDVEGSRSFTLEVLNAVQITTTLVTGFVEGEYHEAPLEASGGSQPLTWRGRVPSGLSITPQGMLRGTPMQTGLFYAGLGVEDANHAMAEREIQIEIAAAPDFELSPTSLRFETTENAGPTAPQQVAISSNPAHQHFDTQISVGWLHLSANRSITPAVLTVFADPGTRQAGTYSTIVDLPGSGTSLSVELIVHPAAEQSLSANPPSVSVLTQSSAQPESRLVMIRTQGDPGPVSAHSAGQEAWLSLATHELPDGSGEGILLELIVDPAHLPADPQQAVVQLTAGELVLDLPIQAAVSIKDFELSHSGLTFDAHIASLDVLPQELRILNRENQPLQWLVEATDAWVQVDPGNGVAETGSSVQIRIDKTGLGEGVHTSRVIVTPAEGGVELSTDIVLNLTSQFLKPRVSPAGHSFFVPAGGDAANTQIQLINPSDTEMPFVLSATAEATWLTVTPQSGAVPAGGITAITVEANPAGQPAADYPAAIDLEFADGTVRTIQLRMAALPATCEPSRLVVTGTKLSDHFEVQSGWPIPIEVRVTDNCGHPVSEGAGVVEFSSLEETAVALIPGPEGLWTGTWTPASAHDSITATLVVEPGMLVEGTPLTPDSLQITGTVVEDNP